MLGLLFSTTTAAYSSSSFTQANISDLPLNRKKKSVYTSTVNASKSHEDLKPKVLIRKEALIGPIASPIPTQPLK